MAGMKQETRNKLVKWGSITAGGLIIVSATLVARAYETPAAPPDSSTPVVAVSSTPSASDAPAATAAPVVTAAPRGTVVTTTPIPTPIPAPVCNQPQEIQDLKILDAYIGQLQQEQAVDIGNVDGSYAARGTYDSSDRGNAEDAVYAHYKALAAEEVAIVNDTLAGLNCPAFNYTWPTP